MKMINTDNCEAFTTELLKVSRGTHPDYYGDRLYNRDAILTHLAINQPKKALDFALEIQHMDPDTLGLHPNTLKLWANTLIRQVQLNIK